MRYLHRWKYGLPGRTTPGCWRIIPQLADEVQNLANKSSVSAQHITELIENSIKMIRNGSTLSTETTEALALVVVGAKQAKEKVHLIPYVEW